PPENAPKAGSLAALTILHHAVAANASQRRCNDHGGADSFGSNSRLSGASAILRRDEGLPPRSRTARATAVGRPSSASGDLGCVTARRSLGPGSRIVGFGSQLSSPWSSAPT